MLRRIFFVAFSVFIFLQFGTPMLLAQTAEDDEVINVDTALVNVPFSVSDRAGKNILGLDVKSFTLFEDGKPQKIEYLSTQDTPLNVVLMLDTSQSAQETFDKIKFAAGEFIKQLRPKDQCMIVSFDAAARVKTEFTPDQKRLNGIIKRMTLSQKPGTVMRDALFVIVNKELVKVKGRKAIILITDGKDAGSLTDKNALLYHLAESDAPIYSIFYETVASPAGTKAQNNPKPLPDNQKYNQKKLKQFQTTQRKKNEDAMDFLVKASDISGGKIFQKEINNLGDAFNQVTEELRKQYLIGFYPDESNYNISKHQIKIKVDLRNAIVRMKNYSLLHR